MTLIKLTVNVVLSIFIVALWAMTLTGNPSTLAYVAITAATIGNAVAWASLLAERAERAT